MSQAMVMQEGDGQAQLVSYLAHVLNGVGDIIIVFQEVKHT